MDKVLVTGGSGLVGSAIKSISHEYDYKFLFINSKICDLRDYESTKRTFEVYRPDYVIHLAAKVGGLYYQKSNMVDMLEENMAINYNVLKCSHEFNVKKCVSALSTCIFPDDVTYPINEKMLHDGPPHSSNYAYSHAKRILDIHSRAYSDQHNDNFVCVIPTNIYGYNDNFNLKQGHVIPSLIHKCYLSKKNNEDFTINGTGKSLRQFIYNEDLAELIMWSLENYNDKEPIILSVDEEDEISIKDLAHLIANKFDHKKIKFDETFSDGQYKKTADNRKLKSLTSFEFTPIEEGISKTIDWFIKNYDNCRK